MVSVQSPCPCVHFWHWNVVELQMPKSAALHCVLHWSLVVMALGSSLHVGGCWLQSQE
jgi:hypothetical protein